MRQGYLVKTTVERYNLKRGWFATEYRIVEADGTDMVQPYFRTKKDAKACARKIGIALTDNTKR